MKFSIVGADIETGKERRIVIEAENEDQAISNAKAEGIFAYQVAPIVALPEQKSPDPNSHNFLHSEESRGTAGVIGIGFFAAGLFAPFFAWSLMGAGAILLALSLIAVAVLCWVMAWDHDEDARRCALQRQKLKDQQAQIICSHCQQKGCVTTQPVRRKKGIDGGKAADAVITGGFSVLLTGLSHHEWETKATCSNCGSVWHY